MGWRGRRVGDVGGGKGRFMHDGTMRWMSENRRDLGIDDHADSASICPSATTILINLSRDLPNRRYISLSIRVWGIVQEV